MMRLPWLCAVRVFLLFDRRFCYTRTSHLSVNSMEEEIHWRVTICCTYAEEAAVAMQYLAVANGITVCINILGLFQISLLVRGALRNCGREQAPGFTGMYARHTSIFADRIRMRFKSLCPFSATRQQPSGHILFLGLLPDDNFLSD